MTRYGLRRRLKMGRPSVRKPYTGLITHGSVLTPMRAACSAGARPSWSFRACARARPSAPCTK